MQDGSDLAALGAEDVMLAVVTMQTVECAATGGSYDFVTLDKPANASFLVVPPKKAPEGKPSIVFWDLSADKVDGFAAELMEFLKQYRPLRLLISGPLSETLPGIEENGAELLLKAFAAAAPPLTNS